MSKRIAERAVVLGGSMAGLVAAQVLAEVYEEVTVVDRDQMPANSAPRHGVPQGRHVHGLLARGQQALEELFPGLTADLIARGVPAGDLLSDVRWYFNGHRLRQIATGLVALSASRPLLEATVRARVRALPRVTFLEGCDAVGLVTTPDNRRVVGAWVLRRADGSAEEVLGAELVVDAMGRGSRTPVWLEALGYERPEAERVQIGLGYSTRTYRLRRGALGGDLAIVAAPTPEHPRGGALAMLEGDRCMLTLAGVLGDYPPRDPAGFLAFAQSLPFPDIYETIRAAEPLDNPVAYRFPASFRHCYERLTRFPDGLLVVGDALCSFNPVYGQGISVTALEGLTLRRHLERAGRPQPQRFFRDVTRVIRVPWDIAAGGDLAFSGVEGRRTRKLRLVNAYIARLLAAAAHDAGLSKVFVRVDGLVDRPGKLLSPGVAFRVLRKTLPQATGPLPPKAVHRRDGASAGVGSNSS